MSRKRKLPPMKTASAFDDLSDRQARYVDEYMIDRNQTKAAARAGYKSPPQSANVLMNNRKVRMAIAELQDEIAKRNRITVDDLVQELEEARQAGLTANIAQSSAAVSATMGKAKMLGFLVDSVDHTSGGEKIESGLGHFYAQANEMYDDDEDENDEDKN